MIKNKKIKGLLKMIGKFRNKTIYDYVIFFRKKTSKIFLKRFFGDFGKNSIIQKPLLIYNKKSIFVGKNVTIRPGLRIEPIKQYCSQNFKPKIIISDRVTIEQNCHIVSANEVIIGKDVTIAGFSFITDCDHDYRDISKGILEQQLLVKKTKIGDQSFIGMGARIMAGVTVGKHCVIGANSVVTSDLPDYAVAVGIPARIIKKYDPSTKTWKKTDDKGDFL